MFALPFSYSNSKHVLYVSKFYGKYFYSGPVVCICNEDPSPVGVAILYTKSTKWCTFVPCCRTVWFRPVRAVHGPGSCPSWPPSGSRWTSCGWGSCSGGNWRRKVGGPASSSSCSGSPFVPLPVAGARRRGWPRSCCIWHSFPHIDSYSGDWTGSPPPFPRSLVAFLLNPTCSRQERWVLAFLWETVYH